MLPVSSDFIECVQGAPFSGEDVLGGFGPVEWLWLLAPTLRPNDIVFLDNLGNHKAAAIRRAIRAARAKPFFLPAYSPDLNPVEHAFSKLKHLLRKAAEPSKDAVWRRIGALLDQLTPHECENYLQNPGYGSVLTQPALAGSRKPTARHRNRNVNPFPGSLTGNGDTWNQMNIGFTTPTLVYGCSGNYAETTYRAAEFRLCPKHCPVRLSEESGQ